MERTDVELNKLAEELLSYKKLKKECEAMLEKLESEVRAEIEKHGGEINTGSHKMSVTVYSRTSFCAKVFKEQNPGLYEEYCEVTEATRLNVA